MGSIAAEALPKPWVQTPLIESAALSKAAGWYVVHMAHYNSRSGH